MKYNIDDKVLYDGKVYTVAGMLKSSSGVHKYYLRNATEGYTWISESELSPAPRYSPGDAVWYVGEEWPFTIYHTKVLAYTPCKRYELEGLGDNYMPEKALFPTSKDLISSFIFIDSTTPPSRHSGKTLGELAAEGWSLV